MFIKLKEIFASEDATLRFPDFSKPFDFTTDASSVAIGAVLTKEKRPITFISRTLSSAEQNGVNNLNIFTDHQPLTFSISDRNPNTKLQCWRSFVEEFTPKFHYKPGTGNVVADALSRQYIQHINQCDNTDQ